MIWNETIECMDREEMRKLQSLRLKRVVEHAYHNSPFYLGVVNLVEVAVVHVVARLARDHAAQQQHDDDVGDGHERVADVRDRPSACLFRYDR